MWQLQKPVAFFVFNRPETTSRVFEEIRKARPPRLMVVADGPRPNKIGEAEKCKAVREIIERVDWPCKVQKNYSDSNMGCKLRMSSGLDWVFDTVEDAIILEDDCLPHPTFFRFCDDLLEKYRDDKRVMMISGNNFQFDRRRTEYSYYFSRHFHIWGWASWRRAWKYYDVNMRLWPEIRTAKWLLDILAEKKLVSYWAKNFEQVYLGEIDTWDYQWTFACWLQNGLCIMPNVNLVSNIGFGVDATHTQSLSCVAEMNVEAMRFPLSHPSFILRDAVADLNTDKVFGQPALLMKIINNLRKIL